MLALYIVIIGTWGVLVKKSSLIFNWQTNLFFVWVTAFIIQMPIVILKVDFVLTKNHLIPICCGILAAIATIIMYWMFPKYKITNLRILMELNIVVTMVLSILILHEPKTIRDIVGIIIGAIAFIILCY